MKQILFALACLLPIVLFIFLPTKKEKTILILGDSLSYAYGIKSEDSWVTLLQQRLDEKKYHYKVINSSISGDITSHGLKRLPWALKEFNPIITIIELGANDGLNNLPITDIKNNLLTIITLAKRAHSKVLLLGMRLPLNYSLPYRKAFESIYPNLAKQENVALVPLFLKNVDDNSRLMQDDKLHPVKEGEAILLETVWPELEKLLSQ